MNSLQEQVLREERESFKIDSLQGATWAFRKLRAINDKESEVKAIAEGEMSRIQMWLESELRITQNDREYFESILTAYYQEEKQKDSKFKLSTPYGKISSTTRDKYYYDDENAIKDYCKANELDCIRVKEELDKTEFKKLCKGGVNQETGEVVPGVRVLKETNINVKVG